MLPPDLSDYIRIPDVPVVDEFKMRNEDGSFAADINTGFLDRLVNHMNERYAKTGDFCPVVIGHTKDNDKEVNHPPVVGFLTRWTKGELFNTGRQAAKADLYLRRSVKLALNGVEQELSASEIVKRYPRRSAELWTSRYEADPVSLLGATTPARDLGVLKLNREGSITYYSPGEIQVPNDEKPAPDKKETGENKQLVDLLQQVLAAVNSLKDSVAPKATGEGKPGEVPGQNDELSDEEFEQLLKQLGEEEPEEKEEKPKKKEEPEVPVKMERTKLDELEQSNATLANEVARLKLSRQLAEIRDTKHLDVDPNDEALLNDLSAMPPEMRNRQLERIVRNARPLPSQSSFNLESALALANDGNTKRVLSREENQKVIKLALDKKIEYEVAARELGYSTGE